MRREAFPAAEIIARLPAEAPPGLAQWALRNHRDELGGDFLLYNRESHDFNEGSFIGLEYYDAPPDYHWAARCTCTACGEEFFTGWSNGGLVLAQGPDGNIMTVDGFLESELDFGDVTEIQCVDGDRCDCPYCGAEVWITRRAAVKKGRTFQFMAGRVESIGDYTALLFYLISRRLESDGNTETTAAPMYAVVIDKAGGLRCFGRDEADGYYGRRKPGGRWQNRERDFDPFQVRYRSYGAINGTKVGGFMYPVMACELAGKTGEKTGVADYISGGELPVMYLTFWRSHRNIENLVKAGWVTAISGMIWDEADSAWNSGGKLRMPTKLEELADWSAARPHDMLGMGRGEVREFSNWNFRRLQTYRDMRALCGVKSARDFAGYVDAYGEIALRDYCGLVRRADLDGADSFPKLDRYLGRQHERGANGLRMFLDYRRMIAFQAAGPLTETELWPPHLRQAHDRASDMQKAENDSKYAGGFARIAERWAGLEWSDGEICALLPRANSELVAEGKSLRHCVGGYGLQHCEGKIIVFIRHARRPERSWFTLNIDLTGAQPREIQLHGYGNEFAKGKRLRIPKRVREFCDTWERDVLGPVFRRI